MQKSKFRTRLTSLYGSQTSSAVLSPHNSVLSTITKMLYWFSPHLWFCACKTAWLASELLVSMGPCPHTWFLDAKQQLLDQNNKSLWVPDLTCHFVHAKPRDLHQNDKSIWVSALLCGSFHANSDFKTRLTSLYGSHTSCVVLSTHNCLLSTRIKRLYGFQP